MSRTSCIVGRLAVAAAVFALATSLPATGTDAPPQPPSTRPLLGSAYPLEVAVSFHIGLLHWIDSLANLQGAGFTSGKTVAAHQGQFNHLHGRPSKRDLEMLRKFREARFSHVRREKPEDRDRLTLAFLDSSSLDEALQEAGKLMQDGEGRAFAEAVRHFGSRYEAIWKDGLIPNGFLERSRETKQREELTRFLVGVARFFGVSPKQEPHPQLVLVPVPPGYGTHAQAIGRFLLIEVRRGESLVDEVAPIVHENAHFLHSRMAPSRLRELDAAVPADDSRTRDALYRLREALPTAIAQGVASEAFLGKRWSSDAPWYHVREVDRYAKRIFPIVKQALQAGSSFDAALLKRMIAAHDP